MADELKIPFKEAWERVRGVTKWTAYAQMADYLEIRPSSISGAKQRGSFPLEWLYRIALGYDSYVEWLASGKHQGRKGQIIDGSSMVMEEIAHLHVDQPCERCSDNENAKLALYNAEPSAGNGTTFDDEHIVDWYPVSRKWLKEAGLNEKNLVVVAAKGDSMQPTIKDGDLLMLDRSKTKATAGVYVIRMSGELFVKRVQKNPIDNSVTIKSDNNTYDPIVAREDQLSMLDIVGKVVWIGTRP